MYSNQLFQPTSMEKCLLCDSQKLITSKVFKVYIPRLMPKISFSTPVVVNKPVSKSLLNNEVSDVKSEIETANHLVCKTMTDYRSWHFGQIYKMTHSDSQTETEVVPEGAPGGSPFGPVNHDGEHMTGRVIVEERDNEDLVVSKGYKDPLAINGVSRPLSWSNSVKKQKHDHLKDSRGDGHPPQPHKPHVHPIKKPFQFFNVKYEELNNINIKFGKEMVGTFISGDLNDFRILHIPDVIPQEHDYSGSSPKDIVYEEIEVEQDQGYPEQGSGQSEDVDFSGGIPEDSHYTDFSIDSKPKDNPYSRTKEEQYDTTDPDYVKKDPGDPEPQTVEEDNIDEEERELTEDKAYQTDGEINVVAIDPGHGGSTIGASANGLNEQDVVLDIGIKLKSELESRGYKVVMSRTTNVNVSFERRVRVGYNNGADIFVSLHNNAASSTSAKGTETLYNPESKYSKQLAGYVQNQFINNLPYPMNENRGLKARTGLAVLNWAKGLGDIPAILTETGFISNPDTNQLLRKDEIRETIAKSIADGIDGYKQSVS